MAVSIQAVNRASATLVLILASSACHSSPELPPRRTLPNALGLKGLWSEASVVSTGTLSEVKRIGATQRVSQPNGDVVPVYPCEAEFIPSVLIKGQLNTGTRKILWFAALSNCTFEDQPHFTSNPVERLWFFRTDGDWLRPVADNTRVYLELFQPFSPHEGANATEVRSALAIILLTPSAVSPPGPPLPLPENKHLPTSLRTPSAALDKFKDFAELLPYLFDLACEVAGDHACYQALGALERQSPPQLQDDICAFLAESYDQCGYSACPQVQFPLTSGAEAEKRQPKRVAIPEGILRNAMASGDKARIQFELGLLHMLSCNRDTSVREITAKQLKEYFPDDPPLPCVPCR